MAVSVDRNWGAVWSLGACVASLTTAELLPISLLTSMSGDLNISEGVAGQIITATAIAAFLASITIGSLAGRLDRRVLMLLLAALQIGSSLTVAMSVNFGTLLAGRVLLGIALGGFWAMGSALTTRLVPMELVPKALSIVFGGAALATVMAAPIGSYLDGLMGWRDVFMTASAFSCCAFVALALSLPPLPVAGKNAVGEGLKLLQRPRLRAGLLGIILVFGGHFALFSYLRPFLQNVTGLSGGDISVALLVFGVGSFFGTSASGRVIGFGINKALVAAPIVIAVMMLGMLFAGHAVVPALTCAALWGLTEGVAPVSWSAWITLTASEDVESGGGLLVAAMQIAITAGAVIGGIAMDHMSAEGTVAVSVLLLIMGSAAFGIAVRIGADPVDGK